MWYRSIAKSLSVKLHPGYDHQAKYYAHELSIRSGANGVERLSQSLFGAKVDVNLHQIEAALFALKNPLSKGEEFEELRGRVGFVKCKNISAC